MIAKSWAACRVSHGVHRWIVCAASGPSFLPWRLFMPSRVRLFGALSATVLLAGCAVGPDFKKPTAPEVSAYTAQPLAATAATPEITGGDAQRFIQAADISGDWWTLFHSQTLNDLVTQALKNNFDLKAAQASLKQAHENAVAKKGAFSPQVTAGFAASHQEQPLTLAPVPDNNMFQYNLFTPQLNVSYVPDVFGLTRRTVESY